MKDLGHKLDEYINVWGRFTFLLPFAFLLSWYKGFPETGVDYWIYSMLSGLVISISTIYLSKAFKYGHISLSIALWKINVIALLVLEILFLNEKVSLMGFIGLTTSLIGVYLLNIKKAHASLLEPIKMLYRDKGLRYALIAGLLLAPVSLFYKKTILLTDPYFPLFTNFVSGSIFMLIPVLFKSRQHLKALSKHQIPLWSMGFLAFVTTLASNIAYSQTVAAYVEAVKQSEIIFGLLAGMFFFKEHEKIKEIWLGSLIIIGGILILIFFN